MCNTISQALRVYTDEEKVLIKTIKEEQDNCFYCKQHLDKREKTLDHIQPLNRGGKTVRENLVVACEKCNSEKTDMTLVEYMKFLQKKDAIKISREKELEKIENTIINTKYNLKILTMELAEYMDVERKIKNLRNKIIHFEKLKEVQINYKNIIENQFDLQEEMMMSDMEVTLGRLHVKNDEFGELLDREYTIQADIKADEMEETIRNKKMKRIQGAETIKINIDELIFDKDKFERKLKTLKVRNLINNFCKFNSFLDDGLIEVRRLENGKYFVVDKYCQLIACNKLEIKEIEVIVIC